MWTGTLFIKQWQAFIQVIACASVGTRHSILKTARHELIFLGQKQPAPATNF
jgi:hypothetical protein